MSVERGPVWCLICKVPPSPHRVMQPVWKQKQCGSLACACLSPCFIDVRPPTSKLPSSQPADRPLIHDDPECLRRSARSIRTYPGTRVVASEAAVSPAKPVGPKRLTDWPQGRLINFIATERISLVTCTILHPRRAARPLPVPIPSSPAQSSPLSPSPPPSPSSLDP